MPKTLLEDVSRQIERRRSLRFSPQLEKLYLVEYAANRARLAFPWALAGTLIYNILTIGDAKVMPDVASELAVARLGVFTPAVLSCLLILKRWPAALVYDVLSVFIVVFAALLPMSISIHSDSAYLYLFHTGSVPTFLLFAICLRPRFPAIVVGMLLLCAIQFTTAHLNPAIDGVTSGGLVDFYTIVAVFLTMSAFFMERKERLSFLHQLQGRLLLEALEHKSERDELTGLYNRHSLVRIRQTVWTPAPRPAAVGVLMLDIDYFKLFNDLYGHLEGDKCIREVAKSVLREVGAEGEVFRFGGEELLVLLPGAGGEAAVAVAHRVRGAVEGLGIVHEGRSDRNIVTVSVGVSAGVSNEHSLEDLMKSADGALYTAKKHGRNAVRLAVDTVPPQAERAVVDSAA